MKHSHIYVSYWPHQLYKYMLLYKNNKHLLCPPLARSTLVGDAVYSVIPISRSNASAESSEIEKQ